jgi:hypothetical protein
MSEIPEVPEDFTDVVLKNTRALSRNGDQKINGYVGKMSSDDIYKLLQKYPNNNFIIHYLIRKTTSKKTHPYVFYVCFIFKTFIEIPFEIIYVETEYLPNYEPIERSLLRLHKFKVRIRNKGSVHSKQRSDVNTTVVYDSVIFFGRIIEKLTENIRDLAVNYTHLYELLDMTFIPIVHYKLDTLEVLAAKQLARTLQFSRQPLRLYPSREAWIYKQDMEEELEKHPSGKIVRFYKKNNED